MTRLKTNADPTGTKVLGTINNCAGGVTPWGTYVMAEENFHGYFAGELAGRSPGGRQLQAARRSGRRLSTGANFYDRFDVSKEPNEPNRFGWMVEVDSIDPTSTPKKRTALGRFKHEGAESIVAKDGRVVFYLGDDERFDYVYKFVTAGTFNPNDRAANMDLLDDGTLYVAKFAEDGSVEWLPIVHGQGPLTAENGFASQADVLIETRRAGDLLGATKMDRPEDIAAQRRQRQGLRDADQQHQAQGRPGRRRQPARRKRLRPHHRDRRGRRRLHRHQGQVGSAAEVRRPVGGRGRRLLLDRDDRERLVRHAGQLRDRLRPAGSGSPPTARDRRPPAAPTGSGRSTPKARRAATSKLFFRVPIGAEMCGPQFTPDAETAFVAVQHPGDGGDDWEAFGRPSYYEDLSTRWPDFKDDMPVRPAVVVITKQGGGKIGV